jgi:signal peptidase
LTGRQLIVIRGGSMEPTIPTGGLVLVERPVDPSAITPGEIVTLRAASGTVYTHRVAHTFLKDGVATLVTKGDANAGEDGAAIRASDVIGVAKVWLPTGGFVVSFLQTTSGRIAFFALLLAAFALRWFWDDLFGPTGAPTPAHPGDRQPGSQPA